MDNKLAITYVPLASLRHPEKNPRLWSNEVKAQLEESIRRYGVVDALIVNNAPGREGIILGGNLRAEILKKMGYKTVPVIYITVSDPERELEIIIRLNKNVAEFDLSALAEFDPKLLADIGFNSNELEEIWDNSLETKNDSFNVTDELSKITEPKTKIGDIYQLGRHRLICSDSTDPETVKKLLNGTLVDMVYCDGPYNIKLDYHKGIGMKGKYGGTTNDNKSFVDYQSFIKKTIENALSVAKDNAHFFYWCDQNYVGMIQDLYRELGIENKRTCLWIKNNQNVVPQVAFNKMYEPCVYGTRGKPYLSENHHDYNEVMNKEIGTGNQLMEDILGLLDIWLIKRLPGQEYKHPTEKPPTLHEKAIKRCTKINDVVLDLFAGSSSTLIACEQLKRVAYLAEIEPIFCDLAINRFEALTKIKAIKLN